MATLKETLDLPLSRIMSMSKEELRKEVQRLSMESNKRLAQFKRAGKTSPATAYIKKHGGKFSSKDKSLKKLRIEFQRAKQFLESETGTIKGYKAWETKVATTLEENTASYIYRINPETGIEEKIKVSAGIDYNSLTETQKKRFWKVYAKLEELDQANVYDVNYRGSVQAIYTAIKGGLKAKQIDAFATALDRSTYKKQSTGFLKGENNPLDLANQD